jgi:hypothetical protein
MSKSKIFLFAPLGLLALFACSSDSEHSPTGPNLRLQEIHCADECSITTDSRPFLLARSSRDSLAGTLALAEITLDGTAGATVSLGLAASSEVLAALPPDTRILVTAGAVTKSFAISQLTSARGAIYRFEAARSIRILYALSRGAPASVPLGDIRLTQYSNSAVIVSFGTTMDTTIVRFRGTNKLFTVLLNRSSGVPRMRDDCLGEPVRGRRDL